MGSLWPRGQGYDCETGTEERLTELFVRAVESFWLFMSVSLVVGWMLTDISFAELLVDSAGLPAEGGEAAYANGVVLVPLIQLVPVCLLVVVVLARSYEVESLSDGETERIRRRLRTKFVPAACGAGFLAVLLMVAVAGGITQPEDLERDTMFIQDEDDRPELDPFPRRLGTLWGVAVYSTAGATGLFTGALLTLDGPRVVLVGLVCALVSTLLYPETVLTLL